MSYLVICPNGECGKRLRIPANAVGHHVRCTACSHKFLIDAASLQPWTEKRLSDHSDEDKEKGKPSLEAAQAKSNRNKHRKELAKSSAADESVTPQKSDETRAIDEQSVSDAPANNLNNDAMSIRETQLPFETLESAPDNDNTDGLEPADARRSAGSERLGRYLVRERLGAGAFGSVYRCYDPQLDRDVAVKIPHATVVQNPKRVERFFREARAAAGLRHPNIVPVFDSGKVEDSYFIAAAFITGRPLENIVADGGIEFRKAAELVRNIAQGLAYAHSQGVVHRDIKPANILVDEKYQPLIADFGLASRQDDNSRITTDGTIMGTPSYMAPEQASGQQGDAQPASDQYSLGVVLYELLTGKTPFEGPPSIVMHNQIHTPPEPPSKHRKDTPRDLETICLKALAKRPEDRFTDCQELADDLRRWMDGEPILARRLGWVERAIRWTKKEPQLAAAIAVIIASLGVIGVLLTVRNTVLVRDLQRVLVEKAIYRDKAEKEAEAAATAIEGQIDAQFANADSKSRMGDANAVRQLVDFVPLDRRDSDWGFVTMRADRAPDFRRRFSPGGRVDPRMIPNSSSGAFAVLFPPKEKSVMGLTTTGPFAVWNLLNGKDRYLPPIPEIPYGLPKHQISVNGDGSRIAFAVMNGGKPGPLVRVQTENEQFNNAMPFAPIQAPAAPAAMPAPVPTVDPQASLPTLKPSKAVSFENDSVKFVSFPLQQPSPDPQPSVAAPSGVAAPPAAAPPAAAPPAAAPPAAAPPLPNNLAQPGPAAETSEPSEPLSFDVVVMTTDPPTELRKFRIEGTLPTVALSHDGNWLAIAYALPGKPHQMGVWNISTGERITELNRELAPLPFQGVVMAFSPDDRIVAATTALRSGEIMGWSIPDGKQVLALTDDVGIVSEIEFSPDSSRIAAVGGQDIVQHAEPLTLTTKTMLIPQTMTYTVTVCRKVPEERIVKQIDAEGFECTAKQCVVKNVFENEARERTIFMQKVIAAEILGGWISGMPRSVVEQVSNAYTVTVPVTKSVMAIEKIPGTGVVDGKEEPCNCEVTVEKQVTEYKLETRTRTIQRVKQAIEQDLVRIWDCDDAKLTFRVEEPELVTAIAWRSDGKRLAGATTGVLNSPCELPGDDCKQSPPKSLLVKFWHSRSERLLMTLDDSLNDQAAALAISPDGLHVAIALEKSPDVICWSAESDQLIANRVGLPGGMHQLAFSQDGDTLAGFSRSNWSAWLFDTKSISTARKIKSNVLTEGIGFGDQNEFLTGLSLRPESAATNWARQGIAAWDRKTGKPFVEPSLQCFQPSADGRRLLVSGKDATNGTDLVQVLDAKSGKLVASLVESTSRGFWRLSRDGHWATCLSEVPGKKNVFRLQTWDATKGEILFSREGLYYVSGILNAKQGDEEITLLAVIQIEPTAAIVFLDLPNGNVISICPLAVDLANQPLAQDFFTSIGEIIPLSKERAVLVSRNRPWAKLWNMQTRKEIAHLDLVQSNIDRSDFCISPDGNSIASIGVSEAAIVAAPQMEGVGAFPAPAPSIVQGPNIKFTDVTTGESKWIYNSGAQTIDALAFSPDSTRLAVGGSSFNQAGLLDVFDLTRQDRSARYLGHSGTVTSVAFNPSGTILASSSCDRSIKLWKAPAPGSDPILVPCDPIDALGSDVPPATVRMPVQNNMPITSPTVATAPAPMPPVDPTIAAASQKAVPGGPTDNSIQGSVAFIAPIQMEWEKLQVTTSGNFTAPNSPAVLIPPNTDESGASKPAKISTKPVLTTHPVSRQNPATIHFTPLTVERSGILKIALRSENDEPSKGGGARIVIKVADQLVHDLTVGAKQPTILDVPFDHQPITMEHHATGWNDEYLFQSFAIVKPPVVPQNQVTNPDKSKPQDAHGTSKDSSESSVGNDPSSDPNELRLARVEQELLKQTNAQRAKLGLNLLRPSDKLFLAARQHAANMARQNHATHNLDGKDSSDRIAATGYNMSASGENVAGGQENVQIVIDDWMNSPGHRRNMLSPDYLEIGVAMAESANGEKYWVQVFGTQFVE